MFASERNSKLGNAVLPTLILCASLASCTTPKSVSIPPAPAPGEPAGIAGLHAAQVKAAFGQPAFVRSEGSYELWRYDSASCKAFFFLYREGDALSVRHVETTPRGSAMAADVTCLDALKAHPATS